jgi:hypothetical protein
VEKHNTGTFPETRRGAVVTEVSIGMGTAVIRTRTDLTEPSPTPRDSLVAIQRMVAAPVVDSLLRGIAAGRPPVDGFTVLLQKHGGHRGMLEKVVIGGDDPNTRKAARILKDADFARLLNVPSTQVADFAGPEIAVTVHSFQAVCGGYRNWPIADGDQKAVKVLYDRLRPLAAKQR